MTLPKNKWLAAALLWLIAGIYSLIFRESNSHLAPPFPHFDKIAHAALFFAQTWLLAKAWLAERKRPPIAALFFFALCYAPMLLWPAALTVALVGYRRRWMPRTREARS